MGSNKNRIEIKDIDTVLKNTAFIVPLKTEYITYFFNRYSTLCMNDVPVFNENTHPADSENVANRLLSSKKSMFVWNTVILDYLPDNKVFVVDEDGWMYNIRDYFSDRPDLFNGELILENI